MRKLFLYMVIGLLCSCEVIKEEDRLIPVPTPVTNSRTHVLLEYTGFRCVNCPTAAQTAQALQELYGEQLIVVSLHPVNLLLHPPENYLHSHSLRSDAHSSV